MGCGTTTARLSGIARPESDEGDVNQEWARIWGIVIRLTGSFCRVLWIKSRMSRLKSEEAMVKEANGPLESHSGSSKSPLITNFLITDSSSSSNGSPPVKRQYSMTPRDHTSTSDQ